MKIVYYSGSGNTEKMARLIAKGVKSNNIDVEVIDVSNADENVFDNEEVVIMGCSAMGDEVLEESEFEPFMESIERKLAGKKVALFGSYDGEMVSG